MIEKSLSKPARLAAYRVPDFEVTAETVRRREETKTDILVRNTVSPKVHTAMRVTSSPKGDALLTSAFCLAVSEAALPQDVEAQDATNRAAETVLSQMFEGQERCMERLTDQLRQDWNSVRHSLEIRWAELEGQGVYCDRLSAILSGKYTYVGLAYSKTLLGQDEIFGVYRVGKDYSLISRPGRADVLTHEHLSRVTNLSSEEKLWALHPQGGPELERARVEFDAHRLSPVAVPIALSDAVASRRTMNASGLYSVNFRNGDRGSVSSNLDRQTFSASLTHANGNSSIVLRLEADGTASIERARVHEKRFKTVEDLTVMLGRALQMIVALDPALPQKLEEHDPVDFDPDHTVLANIPYLPHHRSFLALFLGEPYATACRASERFATRLAKKEEKIANLKDTAKRLPDGAVVGKVDKRPKGELPVWLPSTRLGQVRSVANGNRTRRQIQPLYGFTRARPMTAKHLASLPPLSNPDVLRHVHDIFLLEDQRDLVEAAFRLSLELDSGAPNPLLEGNTEITKLRHAETGLSVRVTRMSGNDSCQAHAISVVVPVEDWADPFSPQTGAAFICETINGVKRYYTRPALTLQDIETPTRHWNAIRFGIGVTSENPASAAAATEAFQEQWKVFKDT